MSRRLILLVALFSLPFAPDISRAQGDQTKIIALENLWNQMQINHEADAMGKMLDSDFVLTDYDGTVMSKSQFLASIRDKSTQLTVEVSEDMKLHPPWRYRGRHGLDARKRNGEGETVLASRALHRHVDQERRPVALRRQPAQPAQQVAAVKVAARHISLHASSGAGAPGLQPTS
jgi:hypothetical protein